MSLQTGGTVIDTTKGKEAVALERGLITMADERHNAKTTLEGEDVDVDYSMLKLRGRSKILGSALQKHLRECSG